jgi:activator of HSP90 ATPase
MRDIHQKTSGMPKNVVMAASFAASAERLFDMYLDAHAHAAFTGQPVTIEPVAGSAFSAFGGVLSGKILHVEPERLIVQTWRSPHFPAAAIDSVLVLTFCNEPAGARIELVQVNVADEDFSGVCQGWEKHYWAPLREYLARHSAS